jgi:hypothetical protein
MSYGLYLYWLTAQMVCLYMNGSLNICADYKTSNTTRQLNLILRVCGVDCLIPTGESFCLMLRAGIELAPGQRICYRPLTGRDSTLLPFVVVSYSLLILLQSCRKILKKCRGLNSGHASPIQQAVGISFFHSANTAAKL